MWLPAEHLIAVASLFLVAPPVLLSPPDAGTPPTLCDAPTFRLPPTIRIEDDLEPSVRWVLEYSPTFREQCRALAAAPQLRATMRLRVRRPGSSDPRARASFRPRPSGGFIAIIELGDATALSELLGHEFEHVIERLDGVDLEEMARQGRARQVADGAFETTRAISAGLRVSGEVADNAPDRIWRATGTIWRAMRRWTGGD